MHSRTRHDPVDASLKPGLFAVGINMAVIPECRHSVEVPVGPQACKLCRALLCLIS